MTRKMLQSLALMGLSAIISSAAATNVMEYSAMPESMDNEGKWLSLDQGVEFQPNEREAAMNPNLRLAQHRFLSSAANKSPYASQSAYYLGYAQAWRMLGFYVDCDESSGEENRDHRGLGENNRATCQRYLLWAAYVDLDYSGAGIGEYQFWDADTTSWDSTTCEESGSSRCAKMDCHNPDSSTWTLLGVYKEAFYASEWFEQLFKHAGYCLWSNDVYEFMQEHYDDWPEGCQDTESTDENGNALYLDLKPSAGGNLTLALYTDGICKTEYMGSRVSVADVAGDDFVTGENLELFNDAMEVWKYCNPCRAANRKTSDEKDDRGHRQLGQGYDDDLEDPNDGKWECNDAAGYTNVNQCMKFRTHTSFLAASMFDLHTAAMQGGMLEIKLGQHAYGTSWNPEQQVDSEEESTRMRAVASSVKRVLPATGRLLVIAGSIFLAFGVLALVSAIRWMRQRRLRFLQIHLAEPLM